MSVTTRSFWTRAYDRWMAVAGVMRRAVAAVIFGTFYLTVGCVFFVVTRVLTRRAADPPTFWRPRGVRPATAAFFRRMS